VFRRGWMALRRDFRGPLCCPPRASPCGEFRLGQRVARGGGGEASAVLPFRLTSSYVKWPEMQPRIDPSANQLYILYVEND
jgi:hypothetical protein